MDNNDIFKKLRVALQLRDDEIVDILQLVDFRISKGEIGNFFRNADHEKYVECGDQVLRNFLNGLVIHLRGTKENPKNAKEVLAQHNPNRGVAGEAKLKAPSKGIAPKESVAARPFAKKPAKNFAKKPVKANPVEKVRFTVKKKK